MRTAMNDFQWTTLRVLGQSKIVSMTMLVPILGFLIIFNDNVVQYLELSESVLIVPNIDDTVNKSIHQNINRLRYIYLGLVIVGIASFFFKIRCPSEIVHHSQEYEFVRAELEIMTSERFKILQDRIRLWKSPIPESLKIRINTAKTFVLSEQPSQGGSLAGQRSLGHQDWLNRNRRSITELLSVLYGIQNQCRLKSRVFIIHYNSLYSVGFITIFPSLKIFMIVLHATVKEFL